MCIWKNPLALNRLIDQYTPSFAYFQYMDKWCRDIQTWRRMVYKYKGSWWKYMEAQAQDCLLTYLWQDQLNNGCHLLHSCRYLKNLPCLPLPVQRLHFWDSRFRLLTNLLDKPVMGQFCPLWCCRLIWSSRCQELGERVGLFKNSHHKEKSLPFLCPVSNFEMLKLRSFLL